MFLICNSIGVKSWRFVVIAKKNEIFLEFLVLWILNVILKKQRPELHIYIGAFEIGSFIPYSKLFKIK